MSMTVNCAPVSVVALYALKCPAPGFLFNFGRFIPKFMDSFRSLAKVTCMTGGGCLFNLFNL